MTQAMLPEREVHAEGGDRRRWLALAVIVAAQFMVVLDVAIVKLAWRCRRSRPIVLLARRACSG